MSEIVDMCMRHKILTYNFELNIDRWNDFNEDLRKIVSQEWKMIKYLNEDGTQLNMEIEKVPDNMGGVYIFLVKPEIIPQVHLYIMYIGRARKRNDYSLRKRCKDYFRDNRPKIATMRELWGPYLYFRYLELPDDETIVAVERELLRVIIPPCNSQIPDYHEMPTKAAF